MAAKQTCKNESNTNAAPYAIAADGRAIRFGAFGTLCYVAVYPRDGHAHLAAEHPAPANASHAHAANDASSLGEQANYTADESAINTPFLDQTLKTLYERCCRYEQLFSRTLPSSDISRAHAAAPLPVNIAPCTAQLIQAGIAYSKASKGLFNIAMGGVTSLWDFHHQGVPSQETLAQALAHMGIENIRLAGNSEHPTLALTDSQTIIDLGGIAKGFITDELGAYLRSAGINRFSINLGGNVLVGGSRPDGEPWRIGIVNPQDPKRHCAVVRLNNGSVVTSGVHERSFTKNGVFYHHILSPQTGFPAQSDIASVSIVAPRSLDGDGYSTATFMMGRQRALDFIEGLPGIEAFIVDSKGKSYFTSGLAGHISILDQPR